MWNWIACNSSTIQVVLTLLTLLVLLRYVWDTRRIAKASVRQIENAQTPFLAVLQQEHLVGQVGGWVLENQGFGPALNIVCGYRQNQRNVRVQMYSLAPRTPRSLASHFENARGTPEGFKIEYESVSGEKYQTFITWEGEAMKTDFKKL